MTLEQLIAHAGERSVEETRSYLLEIFRPTVISYVRSEIWNINMEEMERILQTPSPRPQVSHWLDTVLNELISFQNPSRNAAPTRPPTP